MSKMFMFKTTTSLLNRSRFNGGLSIPMTGVLSRSMAIQNSYRLYHQSIALSKDCGSCWSCGTEVPKMDLFCKEPNCGVVQSIQTSDINLFETFKLPLSFVINEAKLDQSYKELQKKLHPDKFATKSVDEQAVSTNASTAVNMAYQTLKSPISRAEYLIKILFNKNIFDESKLNQDKALMMEMFEWRERIQEVQDKAEAKSLYDEVTSITTDLENSFSKAINEKNEESSLHFAIKMKYYYKMKEDLEESLH